MVTPTTIFPDNPDAVYYTLSTLIHFIEIFITLIIISRQLIDYGVPQQHPHPHLTVPVLDDAQATIPKIKRSKKELHIKLPEKEEEKILAENSFSIQSSYSPSNNYLSFVPHRNYHDSLPCNSKLPIKLYYTIDSMFILWYHISILNWLNQK